MVIQTLAWFGKAVLLSHSFACLVSKLQRLAFHHLVAGFILSRPLPTRQAGTSPTETGLASSELPFNLPTLNFGQC